MPHCVGGYGREHTEADGHDGLSGEMVLRSPVLPSTSRTSIVPRTHAVRRCCLPAITGGNV